MSQGIESAKAGLAERGVDEVDLAIVLGSGLGAFADGLKGAVRVPYSEIPAFPQATVEGHAGNLVVADIAGLKVACLQGRVHAYEGHAPEQVVFPLRLMASLGARFVLLTNAAGGVRPDCSPGDLMLIRDHINLTGNNPLIGNVTGGPRFPDMSTAYDTGLCEAAQRAALDVSVPLAQGVYAGVLGPSYETPAEVRMLKTLGADAVGMSTVWEVIAMRHLGVRVGAMSLITNHAAGLSDNPLSHEEVQQVGRDAAAKMQQVLNRWIERVAELSRTPPSSGRRA